MNKEDLLKKYNTKTKRAYIEMLFNLNNEDLFDLMVSEQVADDWDGMFTPMQRFRRDVSVEVVKSVLSEIGWLPKKF
jgi:hypothetical protein